MAHGLYGAESLREMVLAFQHEVEFLEVMISREESCRQKELMKRLDRKVRTHMIFACRSLA